MEHSIICHQHEVIAILIRHQTHLWRVFNPQPSAGLRKSVFVKSGLEDGHGSEITVPYRPGDLLLVKETWQRCVECGGINFRAHGNKGPACQHCDANLGKWRPAASMVREYSRITLEVAEVRASRVRDITPHDCYAYGIRTMPSCQSEAFMSGTDIVVRGGAADERYRRVFKTVWDANNNTKRGLGFDANPWAWVIGHRVLKAPAYGSSQ